MDEPEAETAEVLREYGPFEGSSRVNGVTYDGRQVWFSDGDRLQAFDPKSGAHVRALELACDAGTAFDGVHLYQLARGAIHKIDPNTGRVVATLDAPGEGHSGLTWAEGTLWLGQYRDRKIHQLDPETGAILRTIESNRFSTAIMSSDTRISWA